MEQPQYELLRIDGKDYVCIKIQLNENGEHMLESELEQRISKLKLNIEKCGSYEKLVEIGGASTEKYLKKTRNMLRLFLHSYQIQYILTTLEDIEESVKRVNTYDGIDDLVKNASWDKIMETAQSMRSALTDNWAKRHESFPQVA